MHVLGGRGSSLSEYTLLVRHDAGRTVKSSQENNALEPNFFLEKLRCRKFNWGPKTETGLLWRFSQGRVCWWCHDIHNGLGVVAARRLVRVLFQCSCRQCPVSLLIGAALAVLIQQSSALNRVSTCVQAKMGKVKAHELRDKSKEEMLKQLEDLKNELAQLRVAKVSGQGGPSKLAKMYSFWHRALQRTCCSWLALRFPYHSKVIRKSIARVLTVFNQTQRVRCIARDRILILLRCLRRSCCLVQDAKRKALRKANFKPLDMRPKSAFLFGQQQPLLVQSDRRCVLQRPALSAAACPSRMPPRRPPSSPRRRAATPRASSL